MNFIVHMPPDSYDAIVDQPLIMLATAMVPDAGVGDVIVIRASEREPFTVYVTGMSVTCERL